MNREVPFEVWSAGLETWEPANLDSDQQWLCITFVHAKNVNGMRYHFYKDWLNRWLRLPMPVQVEL